MPQPGTYMARPLTQGNGNLGMDYMGSDSWLYGNSSMGGGYLPNYMNSATNSLFPTSNVGGSALSNITGNTGNQFTLPNYNTGGGTSGGGSSGGAPFPTTPIPQTQPTNQPSSGTTYDQTLKRLQDEVAQMTSGRYVDDPGTPIWNARVEARQYADLLNKYNTAKDPKDKQFYKSELDSMSQTVAYGPKTMPTVNNPVYITTPQDWENYQKNPSQGTPIFKNWGVSPEARKANEDYEARVDQLWNRPISSIPANQILDRSGDWVLVDGSDYLNGRNYWKNTKTGEAQWTNDEP